MLRGGCVPITSAVLVQVCINYSSEESDAASGDSVDGDTQAAPTAGDLPPDSTAENKRSWLYRYSKSPSPKDPEM